LIMGQALGYLKFGLFDNKKTLFHVWFWSLKTWL
jgi:hypothetical protein